MKKILCILFLYSSITFADPVIVEDDWHLLDSTFKELLTLERYSRLYVLGFENNALKLFSNKRGENEIYEKIILDFNISPYQTNNFDAYFFYELLDNESREVIKVIYAYDYDNNNLHKIVLTDQGYDKDYEIKSKISTTKWEYGTLKSIIKMCDGYKFDYFHIIKRNYETAPIRIGENGEASVDDFFIYDNSFLVKWELDKRPKEFKTKYYLRGGRTDIIINPENDNYVPNKAILSNSQKYIGDISEVRSFYNKNALESPCNFYDKLAVVEGKIILQESNQ